MRKNWTREEIILAIELYCRTSFGRIHSTNEDIINLSQRIGRTPNSVALKMANFASLNPTLDRKGMRNYSKLDEEIWDEFFANPDEFIKKALEKTNFNYVQKEDDDLLGGFRDGGEYVATTKARKNQNYFRQMVLAAYDEKCAITGIDAPELLIASHIMPWSSHSPTRTDPRNGICLNALHDKAFDRGFLTLDEHYKVCLSSKIMNRHDFFDKYVGAPIAMPSRFLPSPDFMRHHREHIFIP